MAYTVRDSNGESPIRLIDISGDKPIVKKEWNAEWICDACAPSRRRYTVQHPAGPVDHHWFQVLTIEDDARSRARKYLYAKLWISCRKAKAEADRIWKEVNL